ncbi:MAG: ABC transporter permease [Acholeplasmataceae bacterium]
MYNLSSLVKRNIKVFIRDKASVFFSFLSVLIMLLLYFLFLGKQYTSDPSLDTLTQNQKTFLSMGVIMGGVLVINTISLSLGVMVSIVNDLQTRKLEGFLVTPIHRVKIILSYFISSFIVTAILTLLMWVATILYLGLAAGYWYNLETILIASLLLLFFTLISSSFMISLVSFIKSQNAFGVLAGILGTVIGFMSGIYMPLHVLGKGMTNVASILPFTHMTILLKQVLLKQPYLLLDSEVKGAIEVFYGTNEIGVFGLSVSMVYLMIGIIILSIIFLLIAYKNMIKKMVK